MEESISNKSKDLQDPWSTKGKDHDLTSKKSEVGPMSSEEDLNKENNIPPNDFTKSCNSRP